MPVKATPSLGLMDIEQEISFNAPAEKVFKALTQETSSWWGAPYLTPEHSRGMVLESKLGGYFREIFDHDGGEIWGVVTAIRKNSYLEITGPCGMAKLNHGVIRFTLEPNGKGTTMTLSHKAMGELTEETQHSYDGGWKDLLSVRLKAWVETGKKMGFGHEPAEFR